MMPDNCAACGCPLRGGATVHDPNCPFAVMLSSFVTAIVRPPVCAHCDNVVIGDPILHICKPKQVH